MGFGLCFIPKFFGCECVVRFIKNHNKIHILLPTSSQFLFLSYIVTVTLKLNIIFPETTLNIFMLPTLYLTEDMLNIIFTIMEHFIFP